MNQKSWVAMWNSTLATKLQLFNMYDVRAKKSTKKSERERENMFVWRTWRERCESVECYYWCACFEAVTHRIQFSSADIYSTHHTTSMYVCCMYDDDDDLLGFTIHIPHHHHPCINLIVLCLCDCVCVHTYIPACMCVCGCAHNRKFNTENGIHSYDFFPLFTFYFFFILPSLIHLANKQQL